jgi:hypothetical protein
MVAELNDADPQAWLADVKKLDGLPPRSRQTREHLEAA